MTSKNIFLLRNDEVFEKTMENVRKHKGIKFLTTKARTNYLASEPSNICFFIEKINPNTYD